MQLDRIGSVNVIGDDVPESRQEYLNRLGANLDPDTDGSGERPRYAQLADEWPRPNVEEGLEGLDEYNSRVQPVNGRGETLRRNGEQIRVGGDFDEFTSADLVVVATGFENQIDEITESLQKETLEDEQIRKSRKRILKEATNIDLEYPGAEADGLESVKVIKDQKEREARVTFTRNDGTTSQGAIEDMNPEFLADTIDLNQAQRAEVTYTLETVTDDDTDGQPIGKRFGGSSVFLTGPSAKLELTEKEQQADPVLSAIDENTVSIFRYADKTEAFGRLAAELEKENPDTSDFLLRDARDVFQRPRVVTADNQTFVAEDTEYSFDTIQESISKLPYDVNSEDILGLVIGEYFAGKSIDVADGLDELTISIRKTTEKQVNDQGETETNINFDMQTNFSGQALGRALVYDFGEDAALQAVLDRITDGSGRQTEAEIVIPTAGDDLRINDIYITEPERESGVTERSDSGDRDASTTAVTPDW